MTLDVVFESYLFTIRILMRIITGKSRMQLPTMYAIPGNPDNLDSGVNIELNTSAPDIKTKNLKEIVLCTFLT